MFSGQTFEEETEGFLDLGALSLAGRGQLCGRGQTDRVRG